MKKGYEEMARINAELTEVGMKSDMVSLKSMRPSYRSVNRIWSEEEKFTTLI